MTGLMIKALELDKIYTLFETEGELMSYARNQGLKKESSDLANLTRQYQRIGILGRALSGDKSLYRKLPEILAHPPLIRVPHAGDILMLHELFELKVFVHYYLELAQLAKIKLPEGLYDLPDLADIYSLLDPDGQKLPTFQLNSPAYPELTRLRNEQQICSVKLREHRHSRLNQARSALNEPSLKQTFVLSPKEKELILALESGGYFHRTGESVSGVNFQLADGPDGISLSAELSDIAGRIKAEEEEILSTLSHRVTTAADRIASALTATLSLAWDYLRADFGLRYSCTIPELTEEPVFVMTGMRNLPVELRQREKNRAYQSLDLSFDRGRVSLITGANMGGKTTVLRSIGQAAQLCRLAIPIPAEIARLAVVDNVWINHNRDTGSEDLSSFGKEVVSLCKALKNPGRTLFLLDEFAKGTNPTEGEAICSAVLAHLLSGEHICIAATHFSAPTSLIGTAQYMTAGFDPAFIDNLSQNSELEHRLRLLSEAMDYRLIPLNDGQSPPRAAVRIAKALGLPSEISALIPEQLK